MFDPNWVVAGAETAVAIETGALMIGNRKPKDTGPSPASAVVIQGVTNETLIMAALIIAAALMLGLVAHAMILNHGVVA